MPLRKWTVASLERQIVSTSTRIDPANGICQKTGCLSTAVTLLSSLLASWTYPEYDALSAERPISMLKAGVKETMPG